VLFFRDQLLTHEQHIAFARNFGDLTRADPHQEPAEEQFPEILVVDQRPEKDRYGKDFEERYRRRRRTHLASWHIDNTPAINPPALSILRAETEPAVGGDTQWTNVVAAYDGLSAPLQRLADTLRAEHRFLAGFHMDAHDPEVADILDLVQRDPLISIHPVVRVISETGEKALFISPSTTSHLIGLSSVESRVVLDLFSEQITRDEYRVRFRWQAGSIAMWDNRATAHLAALDHAHLDVTRRLYRVTVLGATPTGPDGLPSEAVAGRPFTRIEP
jgi:taurine dioxygenase